MTTTSPVGDGRPADGAVQGALRGVLTPARTTWVRLRDALDRPLTSYYLLLAASALLLVIGLIMVLSASSVWSYKNFDGDSYAAAKRQLLWVAIGVPCGIAASRLPERVVRRLGWLGLFVALALLAATQLGLGTTRNGNTNWLGVGPLAIQPSEIAKLALVLWAAHVYAIKERLLGDWLHCLIPVVPGFGVAIMLVLWGNDLGTTLVLCAILVGLLWVVGAPTRMFWIALSLLSVGVFALAATNPERKARLLSFTDPFKDYGGDGWQAVHGLYALSTGGWFGQGIGASQEKWGNLYGAQTDYIFAVIGEELGLIGTLLVLGLFFTIAFAAIRVALHTESPFVRYATFGIVVWLLGQAMINIGMVLAVLPVIGIPLPLISYGGSALVPTLVALGLLIGFARREPDAAAALAAKKADSGTPTGRERAADLVRRSRAALARGPVRRRR